MRNPGARSVAGEIEMEVTQRQVGEQFIRQIAWRDPFEHCGPDGRMAAVCEENRITITDQSGASRSRFAITASRRCHRWLVQQRLLFILFLAVRTVV
jgi:hypothetical protein